MTRGRVTLAAAGLCLAFTSSSGTAVGVQAITLTPGLVIDRSIAIRPGRYDLASVDETKPAVIVRGTNIRIDFQGAVLAGGPDGADPDSYRGVGILIDGGSRVTIANGVIRGYKVGILGRRSPDLRITGNDLSYNWKQRLHSGFEQESLVDWMSYHHNEKDEWLRFGAAVSLTDRDRAEIDHNTVLQGQNGLLVTRSRGLKIWNNTFQFLSSLGIGLYRVTNSTIMHNRIDWCVRGYSHGYYNRGQDSAGLLMYEQSSGNTVAYNSITHGGDGLFLWAGQSTMDTGQGGANDNLFYRNDFSHAPTNGIEATFSSNHFIGNRVDDCWHGVWGGYSYRSAWAGNQFSRNAEAIAIEHGQDNLIQDNVFDQDATAIRLWQNPSQPSDWGYPRNRDTRSRGYRITQNRFLRNKVAYDVRGTADVRLEGNRYETVATFSTTESVELKEASDGLVATSDFVAVPRLASAIDALLPPGARRGREFIIVDEWGPYDWKSPKLWPVRDRGHLPLPYRFDPKTAQKPSAPLKLDVLGPAGHWRLRDVRGASITPTEGAVGQPFTITPRGGTVIDWEVALEYRGDAVTSPRGAVTPAGNPYVFRYVRFHAPIAWTARFFDYGEDADPVKAATAFARRLEGAPLKTLTLDRLDFLSGRAWDEGLPADRFALVAEGTVRLPRGDYTLQLISDDGARVWVDGKLAIDAWSPHGSRVDTAVIGGGTRRLKVEYFEAGGWAELRLDIQPRGRRR